MYQATYYRSIFINELQNLLINYFLQTMLTSAFSMW